VKFETTVDSSFKKKTSGSSNTWVLIYHSTLCHTPKDLCLGIFVTCITCIISFSWNWYWSALRCISVQIVSESFILYYLQLLFINVKCNLLHTFKCQLNIYCCNVRAGHADCCNMSFYVYLLCWTRCMFVNGKD